MKKKVYMAPECIVVELETISMMASSNEGDLEIKPGNGDGFDLESNRHRGEWGNLWEKR